MRNMLLREGDITLQRTVKVCRANETMKLQLKSMSHTTTTDSNTEREIHCIKASQWQTQLNQIVADVAINTQSTKPVLHMVQNATGVAVRTTLQKFADPVITNDPT